MALDAIAEIAFRVVGQFVIEVLFVGIFYWPGWLILRVLTIGRYPPQQSQPHSRELVAMVGFVVFLVGVTIYFTGGA
jgi:hypothetical protein